MFVIITIDLYIFLHHFFLALAKKIGAAPKRSSLSPTLNLKNVYAYFTSQKILVDGVSLLSTFA